MTYTDLIYSPSTNDPHHPRCITATTKKNFNPGSRCTLLNMSLISTAQPQHQVQDSYRPSAGLRHPMAAHAYQQPSQIPGKDRRHFHIRKAATNHTRTESCGFRTTQTSSKAQGNLTTLAHAEAHKASINSYTDHTESFPHKPVL